MCLEREKLFIIFPPCVFALCQIDMKRRLTRKFARHGSFLLVCFQYAFRRLSCALHHVSTPCVHEDYYARLLFHRGYFSIDPFSKKKSFPREGSNNYGENNFHRTYSSKGVSINFIKNKFSPLFDISSSSVSLSSNAPPTRRVIDPWREFYFSQLRDSARF